MPDTPDELAVSSTLGTQNASDAKDASNALHMTDALQSPPGNLPEPTKPQPVHTKRRKPFKLNASSQGTLFVEPQTLGQQHIALQADVTHL